MSDRTPSPGTEAKPDDSLNVPDPHIWQVLECIVGGALLVGFFWVYMGWPRPWP